MRIKDWISSLLQNPLAWIFCMLFVIAEYWNYENGEQLDRVCELTGYHAAMIAHPTSAREELDNICIGREDDDDLPNEK